MPALTGLRFTLALWVILHHLTGKGRMLDPLVSQLPAAAQIFVYSGYLAVSTFFLLSGFVLARSYASIEWSRLNLLKYGIGRYARVYPVYALSLLIMTPWIFTHVIEPGRAVEDAALLANYSFVLQGWGKLPVSWNTPAWSLSCEFFFYLCFPLAAPLLRVRRLGALIAAAALSFALPVLFRELGVPSAWKPLFHFADFLLGISVAGLFDRISGAWDGRGYWFYVPAGSLFVVLATWHSLAGTHLMHDALLRLCNAGLILGLGLGGGVGVRALSTELAVLLGKASYSMYILHIPLLWWFKRFGLHQVPGVHVTLAAAVYLSMVVLLSTAVFRHLEEPANKAIRNWATARLRPAEALAAPDRLAA